MIKENVIELIRSLTSKNLNETFINPAYSLAIQDLEDMVGKKFVNNLLTENLTNLSELESYVGPYLAYRSCYYIAGNTSYKVNNVGVNVTGDEKVSVEEVKAKQDYFRAVADKQAFRLQAYLRHNYQKYPDLSNTFGKNLESSATTGLWLGGSRAYVVPRVGCFDTRKPTHSED